MSGGPSYQTPYPVKRSSGDSIIWDWGKKEWVPYQQPAAAAPQGAGGRMPRETAPAGAGDASAVGGSNAPSGAEAPSRGEAFGGSATGAIPQMRRGIPATPSRRRTMPAMRSLLTPAQQDAARIGAQRSDR